MAFCPFSLFLVSRKTNESSELFFVVIMMFLYSSKVSHLSFVHASRQTREEGQLSFCVFLRSRAGASQNDCVGVRFSCCWFVVLSVTPGKRADLFFLVSCFQGLKL